MRESMGRYLHGSLDSYFGSIPEHRIALKGPGPQPRDWCCFLRPSTRLPLLRLKRQVPAATVPQSPANRQMEKHRTHQAHGLAESTDSDSYQSALPLISPAYGERHLTSPIRAIPNTTGGTPFVVAPQPCRQTKHGCHLGNFPRRFDPPPVPDRKPGARDEIHAARRCTDALGWGVREIQGQARETSGALT